MMHKKDMIFLSILIACSESVVLFYFYQIKKVSTKPSCLVDTFLVEATGVEPVSEKLSVTVSTSVVYH